jgi:hypothetical protein
MPLTESLKTSIRELDESDQQELLGLLQEMMRTKSGSQHDEGSEVDGRFLSEAIQGVSLDSASENSSTRNPQLLHATEGLITVVIDDEMPVIRSRPTTPEQNEVHDSTSSNPPRLSDATVESAITTVGDARFNSQVLLTIDPTKINGQISISFTTERSDTLLGSVQGDHTIPERLLLEFIAKTIAGKTLGEIPDTLHEAFHDSVQDFDASTTPLPEKPTMIPYGADGDKSRKLGIRFQNASSVANYISQTIDRYNHLPLSVIPKDGHAAAGEGTKISTNMTMLRAMNEFLSFGTDIEGNLKAEDVDLFYKEAVLPNGKFVKGMKDFFGVGKIDDVRREYPDTPEGKARFIGVFATQCNEGKVGQLLSEIFDFPYRDSFGIKKDAERTQENLHALTQRCAKMCLGAFPQIGENLDPMGIGIEFEQRVIQKSVDFKIGKGAAATTLSGSWSSHTRLQDWDSVFPLDTSRVSAALEAAKADCMDSGVVKRSKMIEYINDSMKDVKIKFALAVEDISSAEGHNPEAVISGMLQELPDTSAAITRSHLQTLFQEKDQELGQKQIARDGRDER